jgi:hypothetical protein
MNLDAILAVGSYCPSILAEEAAVDETKPRTPTTNAEQYGDPNTVMMVAYSGWGRVESIILLRLLSSPSSSGVE